MDPATVRAVLAAALALHAGFQLTVTLVVYPALADVPPEQWRRAHAAHSRRITPVVGLVYVVALAACALAVARPDDVPTVPLVLAVGGTVAAIGLTAALAAPLHGRLTDGDPALVRRLLVADRLRCVAAVVAVGGACMGLA